MADSDLPGPTGLLAWEHARFERVSAALDLDPAMICSLHCADRLLIVELPLRRDDGSMTVLTEAMSLVGSVAAIRANALSPAVPNPTRR